MKNGASRGNSMCKGTEKSERFADLKGVWCGQSIAAKELVVREEGAEPMIRNLDKEQWVVTKGF